MWGVTIGHPWVCGTTYMCVHEVHVHECTCEGGFCGETVGYLWGRGDGAEGRGKVVMGGDICSPRGGASAVRVVGVGRLKASCNLLVDTIASQILACQQKKSSVFSQSTSAITSCTGFFSMPCRITLVVEGVKRIQRQNEFNEGVTTSIPTAKDLHRTKCPQNDSQIIHNV